MAKLYGEARKVLKSSDSLASMRSQPGVPDEDSVRSAVEYALPVVIGALDRRMADSRGILDMVELLRSLDYSELRTPFMWNSTSSRAVSGGRYLRSAFATGDANSDHVYACRKLAERVLISPPAAERILQDVAWVYCAVLAQSHAGRLDLQTVRASVAEDHQQVARRGYDSWVSAALPEQRSPNVAFWDSQELPSYDTADAPSPFVPAEPVAANQFEQTRHTNNAMQSNDSAGRAIAMASDPGPGRYPPPIRRDQRSGDPTTTGPGRSTGSVPPPQRPAYDDRRRSAPPPRSPERGRPDDTGGMYGVGPGHNDNAFFDDQRQPVRHRPMNQPPSENRYQPPYEAPQESRGVLPLVLGGLALLLVGAGAFWLITSVLGGDDAEGGDIAAEGDTATAEDAAAPATEEPAAADPAADDAAAAPETDAPADPAANLISMSVPMTDIFTGKTGSTGEIIMDIDRLTGEICFTITTNGVEAPYPAHIHRGELGVKGPIAVDFTPQTDAGQTCMTVPAKNVQEILANPSGYYAEMHDAVDKTLTVRGQVSEATITSDPGGIFGAPPIDASTGPPTDPDGGGAFIAIENGAIFLRGEVADEAAAQQVRDRVAGLSAEVAVTDEMTINPAAALPSGIFEINDGIEFDTGSADLRADVGPVLDIMAALINAHPEWSLYITGHTDNVGGDVANLDLSLRRASTVRDEMLARGVPEGQLGVLGAGARQPKVPNDSEENKALNRRIEFEIDAN